MPEQEQKKGYPTPEQMKEVWDAWKAKGKAGVQGVLEKRLQAAKESQDREIQK